MTEPFLREERQGAVLVLTMDGPEDRNALSSARQCEEFVEACRRSTPTRASKSSS
ncbi:hypothetical protein ACFQU7_35010 [Pseudoroseomonas wenyumeiae]